MLDDSALKVSFNYDIEIVPTIILADADGQPVTSDDFPAIRVTQRRCRTIDSATCVPSEDSTSAREADQKK